MLRYSVYLILFFLSVSTSLVAQKTKPVATKKTSSNAALSNAEKMGYARTNQSWGPGTYYSFAPGITHMKMVNTPESAMRDLTGISREDCIAELAKQGFTEVPAKETEKWFNSNKSKEKYYYAPDKSYILRPFYHDLYMSTKDGVVPYACTSVGRYVLVPKEDSLKVMEMAWQYLRDLHSMKLLLGSFGSSFKKANPKAYPIERCGSTGWNSMRAGTFVLRMVDGKPTGAWDKNENIVRRTIGNPEFELLVMGHEIDFLYSLKVVLQKEGYVLTYQVIAGTLSTLEPGSNWVDEHKRLTEAFNGGEAMDKQAVDLYKKAPMPPVMEDLNKVLHIR